MMAYHVEFTKSALRDIKKLDKGTSALILGWIRKNLEGCSDPRIHGKGLTANRSGQWRYRVGDYRIIADIDDSRIVVLVIRIGHRRDIYDR
jgi:mRNA interferase RelE/StbE